MRAQDESTIRAEFAEEFPQGSVDFTEDEWVEANLRDVLKRARFCSWAPLSSLRRFSL
jgi:hypothetical protein